MTARRMAGAAPWRLAGAAALAAAILLSGPLLSGARAASEAGPPGDARTETRAATEPARPATDGARPASVASGNAAPTPAAGGNAPAAATSDANGADAAEGTPAPAGAGPDRALSVVDLPPAPWRILGVRALRTPPVDAPAPCLPEGTPSEARELVLESHRDPEAAAEAAESLRAVEAASRHERFAALVLEARAARTREARRAVLEALSQWPVPDGDAALRACVALEQARLELWLGRHPEAAAHALEAGRLRSRTPDAAATGEAADFLRAEAYALAGRGEEAAALRAALARSEDPALVAGVRLREADAAFDAGRAAAAREVYEALLPHAADFGASVAGWGLRAAEGALAEEDVAGARAWVERWLEEAQGDAREPLVRMRLADLMALAGETATARDVLIRVRAGDPHTPVARLAALRELALHISRRSADERLRRLEEATGDPHPGISRHARALLAREWLARGEADRALALLSRLAFDAGAPAVVPTLSEDLNRALRALAAGASDPPSCARLVERVGWQRRFLARRATDPEPFVRLGGCYERLGFPTRAVEVYRHVATHFGREGAARVALPLARAALRAGDLAVARAAALPRAGEAGPEQAAWKLLLAEIDLAEERAARAAARAAELVAAGEPADDPVAAVDVLARAASAGGADAAARAALVSALGRLARDERFAADPRLGEAALRAAEIERARGALPMARRLYAWAVEALPEGSRRAEAAYWRGALAEDSAVAREALEAAVASEPTGAWGRLARSRLELGRVKARLGAAAPEASP